MLKNLCLALGAATLLASPAVGAQIALSPEMIIGRVNTYGGSAGRAIDQQSGAVQRSNEPWSSGYSGTLTFDLGAEYDFSMFEIFTRSSDIFRIQASNRVDYTGYGDYVILGGDILAQGNLAADTGDILTAQTFRTASTSKYRYIQFFFPTESPNDVHALDEFRIYDRADITAGVPEPATWALMILGFGGAGSVLRRRRHRLVAA